LNGWFAIQGVLQRFGDAAAEFRVEFRLVEILISRNQFSTKCSPNHKTHTKEEFCVTFIQNPKISSSHMQKPSKSPPSKKKFILTPRTPN
jgi:hypothetical protein